MRLTADGISRRQLLAGAAAAAAAAATMRPGSAQARPTVRRASAAGTVELSQDGAWTLWQAPHADCFEGGGRRALLVGVIDSKGDDHVIQYDLDTQELLEARSMTGLIVDDHNSPAVFVRPDGYIETYASNHAGPTMYINVSTSPWTVEQGFDAAHTDWMPNVDGHHGYTYLTPYRLSQWGLDVCFFRGGNNRPTYAWRTSAPESGADPGFGPWSGGHEYFWGPSGQRPYMFSHANDVDRIDFFPSSGNPSEFPPGQCNLYHFYVQGDSPDTANVYKSDGTLIRSWASVVGNLDGTGSGTPLLESEVTKIHDAAAEMAAGGGNSNAWGMGISRDPSGAIAVAYMVWHQYSAEEYRYGRLNPSTGEWEITSIAHWIPGITPSWSLRSNPTAGYLPECWPDQYDADRLYVAMPQQPEERAAENLLRHPWAEVDNVRRASNLMVEGHFTSAPATTWQAENPGHGTVTTQEQAGMPAPSRSDAWNVGPASVGWKTDYTNTATGPPTKIGIINVASPTSNLARVVAGRRYTTVIDLYLERDINTKDIQFQVNVTFFNEAGADQGGAVAGHIWEVGWKGHHRVFQPITPPAGATRARFELVYRTGAPSGRIVGEIYRMSLVPGKACPYGWEEFTTNITGTGGATATSRDIQWTQLRASAVNDPLRPPFLGPASPVYKVNWTHTPSTTDDQRFGLINWDDSDAWTVIETGRRYTVFMYYYLPGPAPPADARARVDVIFRKLDASHATGLVANNTAETPLNQGTFAPGWRRYHSTLEVGPYSEAEILMRLNPYFATRTASGQIRADIAWIAVLPGTHVASTSIERWETSDGGQTWPTQDVMYPKGDQYGMKVRPVVPRHRFDDAPEIVFLADGGGGYYDNYKDYLLKVIGAPPRGSTG